MLQVLSTLYGVLQVIRFIVVWVKFPLKWQKYLRNKEAKNLLKRALNTGKSFATTKIYGYQSVI